MGLLSTDGGGVLVGDDVNSLVGIGVGGTTGEGSVGRVGLRMTVGESVGFKVGCSLGRRDIVGKFDFDGLDDGPIE